jgi:hypothetical protein
MKFKLEGQFIKCVWNNGETFLNIFATTEKNSKEFAVFCNQELHANNFYEVEGYVGKSVSKKYKDDKGRSASEYSFNATKIKPQDDTQQHNEEIPF